MGGDKGVRWYEGDSNRWEAACGVALRLQVHLRTVIQALRTKYEYTKAKREPTRPHVVCDASVFVIRHHAHDQMPMPALGSGVYRL
jgi:hypothetical protein